MCQCGVHADDCLLAEVLISLRMITNQIPSLRCAGSTALPLAGFTCINSHQPTCTLSPCTSLQPSHLLKSTPSHLLKSTSPCRQPVTEVPMRSMLIS